MDKLPPRGDPVSVANSNGPVKEEATMSGNRPHEAHCDEIRGKGRCDCDPTWAHRWHPADGRPCCTICGADPIVRLESTGLIARIIYACDAHAPDYGADVAQGYYRASSLIEVRS